MKRILFFRNTDNPMVGRLLASGLVRHLKRRNCQLEMFPRIAERREGRRLKSLLREFRPDRAQPLKIMAGFSIVGVFDAQGRPKKSAETVKKFFSRTPAAQRASDL